MIITNHSPFHKESLTPSLMGGDLGQPMKGIWLREGTSYNVETGALIATSAKIKIETLVPKVSVWEKVKRYFIGGKPLFINKCTAVGEDGWIAFEEMNVGQIHQCKIKPNKPLTIRADAYFASSINVELSTKYAGIKGCLNGLGIALIKASVPAPAEKESKQQGTVYLNSRKGRVIVLKVTPQNPLMIDRSLVLAYTGEVESTVAKANSVKGWFFSGEIYMGNFTGKGKVYLSSGDNCNYHNEFRNTSLWLTNELTNKLYMVAGATLFAYLGWSFGTHSSENCL